MQSYSLTSCMDVSCKSCLSKLFPKLLHGTIVRGSSFEAISFAFSWNWRAKGISQSYLTKFYMELSRKRAVRQRSWAQSEPCWAQSKQSVRDAACSSRAQVALRSYFLSFCMELSCQSFCMELLLKLVLRSYFLSSCMGTSCKSYFSKLSLSLRLEPSSKS